MDTRNDYKPTWFDRSGPDAGAHLQAYAFGFLVFGLAFGGALLAGAPVGLFVLGGIALVCGAAATAFTRFLSASAGAAFSHLMVNGSTTPYKEQFSYQQSLVMQGRTVEALESFEAVIASAPTQIEVRVKAAELHTRSGNFTRAAELFREIRLIPTRTTGEDIYATNRLVDLLTGPLADRGRALVELRRLVEHYPGTSAAEHARKAIALLKPSHVLPISDHRNANEGDG